MVSDMDQRTNEIVSVGGPEDMTWEEICRTCFECYQRAPRIIAFPKALCDISVKLLKPFSKSSHAMGRLMVFMSTDDFPSQKRGRRRFSDYLAVTT